MAEVSPVDLRLLAGKGIQTQERLADLRTQTRHGTAQLDDGCRCSRSRTM